MRHLQVVDLIGELHLHSADDVHLYEHPTPLTKAQARLLSLTNKRTRFFLRQKQPRVVEWQSMRGAFTATTSISDLLGGIVHQEEI